MNKIVSFLVWELVALGFDTFHRNFKLEKAANAAKNRCKRLLNISCGPTIFGDVNADILPRNVPNFVLYYANEELPFKDKEFGAIYSSHTLEHSEKPKELMKEFERISDEVFLVLPNFWDFGVLNPSHAFIPLDQSGYNWVKNPLYSPKIAKKMNPQFSGNPFVRRKDRAHSF